MNNTLSSGFDPECSAFIQKIVEDPDDDNHRMIFADWLDDHPSSFAHAEDWAKSIRTGIENRAAIALSSDELKTPKWAAEVTSRMIQNKLFIIGARQFKFDPVVLPVSSKGRWRCYVTYGDQEGENFTIEWDRGMPGIVRCAVYSGWVRRGLFLARSLPITWVDTQRKAAKVPQKELEKAFNIEFEGSGTLYLLFANANEKLTRLFTDQASNWIPFDWGERLKGTIHKEKLETRLPFRTTNAGVIQRTFLYSSQEAADADLSAAALAWARQDISAFS